MTTSETTGKKDNIKGLTLKHPWAWAVAHCGKDVENRKVTPERWGGHVGMFLAIHGGVVPPLNTGKREEVRLDLAHVLSAGFPGVPDVSEDIITTLSMGGYVKGEEQYLTPGIVAIARLAGVVTDSRSPWAVQGHQHWQLADVLTLPEPIPHRGAQGLWKIEDHAIAQLRQAWKAAKG